MLDFRELGLEGIERLCQADLTWELVPLYYCPGKEEKACIDFVCSQMAILTSTITSLQILILINGNKMTSQFVKDSESRVHSSLFKGSPVKTAKHVIYARCIVVSSCYPSCSSPLHHLHLLD